MNKDFKNKNVLIIGGSRGIGESISLNFLKYGAKIFINYDKKNDLINDVNIVKKLKEKLQKYKNNYTLFDCDISKYKNLKKITDAAIKKMKHIDILILNAGVCKFSELLLVNEAIHDHTFKVNQKAPFFITKNIIKHMINKKIKGKIVFTSSISSFIGSEHQAHYCSTKGAINQITRSMAIFAGKHQINVNAVLPGTVLTDLNIKQLENNKKLKKYFIDRSCLGRFPSKEDIANAVLFLSSNFSKSITGEMLVVDAGTTIKI